MGHNETSKVGSPNTYGALKKVLVRRPDAAFAVQVPEDWNYAGTPNLEVAQAEHDQLTGVLREAGAEVIYHDESLPDHADSVFVFDPVLVTGQGAIVLRMGKGLRNGEEAALSRKLKMLGFAVISSLTGSATAEGGDLLWLDGRTLVAGRGFRTNAEGVAQLKGILQELNIQLHAFDLPYLSGPRACLHLLSLISILDRNLAVVYPPLMPVALWEELQHREFEIVEVPEQEFATMGPNVLALGPRKCLALEGNPITRKRLENAGCEVFTYRGEELSLKAEGGPTCLTLPLQRTA
ncbi:MAG TPA: arginine deiminase family protein [Acidobacteriota bacterium]|nr:arginine deiminase family protein [Acidobacteriota bacterium]